MSLGYEFRDIMNAWDRYKLMEQINGIKDRIKNIIGSGQFIMFVKKKSDNDIFGTDEDGRLMFAKMKNPDDDEVLPDGWEKEGSFSCTNLSQLVNGIPTQTIFGHKDLKDLEIVDDQEELINMLLSSMGGKKRPSDTLTIQIAPDNDKEKKVIKEK